MLHIFDPIVLLLTAAVNLLVLMVLFFDVKAYKQINE
jgi:hypothetical protein